MAKRTRSSIAATTRGVLKYVRQLDASDGGVELEPLELAVSNQVGEVSAPCVGAEFKIFRAGDGMGTG